MRVSDRTGHGPIPSTSVPDASTNDPSPTVTATRPVGEDLRAQYRTARLIAVVAGIIGMVLALATPFLPVKVTEPRCRGRRTAR